MQICTCNIMLLVLLFGAHARGWVGLGWGFKNIPIGWHNMRTAPNDPWGVDNGGDNALLVVKTKANAIAEVDNKLCAGEVRVRPVKGLWGGEKQGDSRTWTRTRTGLGRTGFEACEETERNSGEDTCKKGGRKLAQFFSSYLEVCK